MGTGMAFPWEVLWKAAPPGGNIVEDLALRLKRQKAVVDTLHENEVALIPFPGEPPIVCEGEVVNVPDKHNFGMGVRFLNMTDDDQKRLEAFTGKVERK